jgi:hypothetical protein
MKRSKAIAYHISIAGAMLLAGCGGGSGGSSSGPGTGAIGGSVSGLPSGITVLLVNNGSDIISANANGSFTFDRNLKAGATYNVTMFTQPTGAGCSIANAQGTLDQNADAVANVAVTCQTATVALMNYNIGLNVSGISAGNSATFLIGGANPLIVNANGLAVFPLTFTSEEEYPPGATVVTVASNPSGQTCTVASGPINGNFADFVDYTVVCQ